jgi:magnesium-transporting ATPase (P-type)
VYEVPFTPETKFQLSLHSTPSTRNSLLVMKGAPEKVFERCSTVLVAGKTVPVNKSE